MRFIGSKALLLKNIEQVIADNTRARQRVFCDIFSGTGAVARYFKPKYRMLSNDLLYFSYAVQKATIENNAVPQFETLKNIGIVDPFAFLEETKLGCVDLNDSRSFIAKNYSPNETCQRMYLSPKNAGRIDFIRNTIESWRQSGFLNENEYFYLLAGLIEGVPFVSNITGTYGAYLKKWDKRAYKDFEMMRLEVTDNGCQNECFHQDANKLIAQIEGDILYIDPPYNSRQYVPNYHLLETIARYDSPRITGVTGMRPYEAQKSAYCVKGEVLDAFADLIGKARFSNIVVSYSTDGLMTSEQIEAVLKKCGVASSFRRYDIPYRKYKSKVVKPGDRLHEQLYFVRKRIPGATAARLPKAPAKPKAAATKKYVKSPLNYIGGKYKLLPQILPLFPKDIATFVDLFSGGANVAINVTADRIICNDLNTKIIELFQAFQQKPLQEILDAIDGKIAAFGLSKTNMDGFLAFRSYYNETKDPIDLYTLTCFSFNYQFRFNNRLEYNNPFGRNRSQFSEQMRGNLTAFVEKLHAGNITFLNQDFAAFDWSGLGPQDIVYCDPPYLITTGTYNDGKRGFKDWGETEERQLLALLDALDENHIRFALSNVLEHKGRKNEILLQWSEKYKVVDLSYDYSNASYHTARGESREVLILNY